MDKGAPKHLVHYNRNITENKHMDLIQFQKSVDQLFIESKEESSLYILDRLKIQRGKLNKLINTIPDGSLDKKNASITDQIRNLYNNVFESINSFLNGNLSNSLSIIYDNFIQIEHRKITPQRALRINANNSYLKDPTSTIKLPCVMNLFRVRSNNSYTLYERNEMFHIPFEKRGLVSNQRYSISGYPCLYIGTSIYGCWEATGRPNIDTFNVVSLKTTQDLNFIDLRIPTITNLLSLNSDFFYQLVLTLACSLEANNSSDTFKPEYIIPQNVLSSIIKRNNNSEAKKAFDVHWDGIIYTSNIYNQKKCLFYDKDKLINIVMPIVTSQKKELCPKLKNAFKMTESTSVINQRITRGVTDSARSENQSNENSTIPYSSTMWGDLENTLLNLDHLEIG